MSHPAAGRPPASAAAYAGLVIAVDGPGGSGKSTVSKALARRLRLRYLDTGAMYRAVTWLALQRGLDPADEPAVAGLLDGLALDVRTDPDAPGLTVGGNDPGRAIRGPEVTAAVSAVSAVPAVREALVARQRELVGAGGIVVEGRDIGTVVVPDAPVKVFLTASSEARAARRTREDTALGGPSDAAATRQALDRRDALDSSRATSPLRPADDAVEVDSTALSVDEVVDAVVALCDRAVARQGPPA